MSGNYELDPRLGQSQAELEAEMSATELAVDNYCRATLANSVVKAEIKDCKHPFFGLPSDFMVGVEYMPTKPRYISSVDLAVDYSRERQLFTPRTSYLRFDNGYSWLMSRLDGLPTDPERPTKWFYCMLYSPEGAPVIKRDDIPVLSEGLVSDVLAEAGIGLPKQEQPADWEAIQAILQFAGKWSAKTESSLPLDDFGTQTVWATEHIEGTGVDIAGGSFRDNEVIRFRKISLAVDEVDVIGKLPHETWKLVCSSGSLDKTPKIKRVQRVPLTHNYTNAAMLENGDAWTGDQLERIELVDQAQNFAYNAIFFAAIRKVAEEATAVLAESQ